MARKEDVDFYCSFSRKELQSLCKKYNLPANRSSSDMAESLASYFERNNFSSAVFGNGGIHENSAAISGAAASGTRAVRKDYNGSKLEIRAGDCSTTTREANCSLRDRTHHQELHDGLIESERARQFIRGLNENGLTANPGIDFRQGTENRLREVNTVERPQATQSPGCSTYSSSSSFEFYVSLEEGINLSVDLNYNPSEWINSMSNEVCIWDDPCPKRSRSSAREEDYLTERKKQKSQDHLYNNNGEGSLASFAIEPCSRTRIASDGSKKDKGVNISMVPDSSAPDQIVSCVESCSKGCCVASIDLDCVNSPGKNPATDSVQECQDNPTGNLANEVSDNPSPRGNPRNVGNSSIDAPICIGGDSSELSSSKMVIDTEQNGSSAIINFQYNTSGNCLASNTEEQE